MGLWIWNHSSGDEGCCAICLLCWTSERKVPASLEQLFDCWFNIILEEAVSLPWHLGRNNCSNCFFCFKNWGKRPCIKDKKKTTHTSSEYCLRCKNDWVDHKLKQKIIVLWEKEESETSQGMQKPICCLENLLLGLLFKFPFVLREGGNCFDLVNLYHLYLCNNNYEHCNFHVLKPLDLMKRQDFIQCENKIIKANEFLILIF